MEGYDGKAEATWGKKERKRRRKHFNPQWEEDFIAHYEKEQKKGQDKDEEKQRIKILFLGEESSGKTCFLMQMATGEFPTEYIPNAWDNTEKDYLFKGQYTVPLSIWDSRRGEIYDRLLPLSFPGTDVVVFCFDVHNRKTMEKLRDFWIAYALHGHWEQMRTKPVLLLGLKTDLREKDEENVCVSVAEATEFAEECGFDHYIEVSTKRDGNAAIAPVIDKAIELYLQYPSVNSSKRCSIQ